MRDKRRVFMLNKGITLIGLVVTIVVLLILAGITIATLTGDNGLLTKAGEAKIASEKSALKEEIDLMLIQAKMGDRIENIFGNDNVKKDGAVYEVKYKGIDFLLSSDYEYVEKIEPQDIGEWDFNTETQTLTKYNWKIEEKRGTQEPGELIIPNYYNGKRVKAINVSFYNNKNIQKLKISYGIEEFKAWGTFCNCTNLTGDIIIPDSVISMASDMFNGCTGANGILSLSNNLNKIANNSFYACNNLKGDIILSNATSIGNNAFSGCNSLNGGLKIGNKVETIGNSAFRNCSSLTGNLIIPDNVTSIGSDAFRGCSSLNGTIKLSNNIVSINGNTFQDCNKLVGDLVIPDSVTYIGDSAFSGCVSLNGILKLSKNLITIDGWGSFYNCNKLNGDIVIPEKVEYVGVAFPGTTSFSSIRFLNKDTQISASGQAIPTNLKIYGYEGSTAQTYANNNNRNFELITP